MIRFIAQKTTAATLDSGASEPFKEWRHVPGEPRSTVVSAHRGDVLRRDLEDHSYLAGLSKRIFILIQIFLRHFVNVRIRAARRTFAHTTTDFEVSIRIVGIDDRQGHTTITLQVLVLLY